MQRLAQLALIGRVGHQRRLHPRGERNRLVVAVEAPLGACLLEKRVTLDRSFEGHHHLKALEPTEFAEWVEMVRRAERVLGELAVRPSEEDLRQKEQFFVSLTAEVDIDPGEEITAEKLACKRPGTGIAPEHVELLLGRTARRPIRRNEQLSWDAV